MFGSQFLFLVFFATSLFRLTLPQLSLLSAPHQQSNQHALHRRLTIRRSVLISTEKSPTILTLSHSDYPQSASASLLHSFFFHSLSQFESQLLLLIPETVSLPLFLLPISTVNLIFPFRFAPLAGSRIMF